MDSGVGAGAHSQTIAGPDGNDASDRWMEALMMKDAIRALWSRIAGNGFATQGTYSHRG